MRFTTLLLTLSLSSSAALAQEDARLLGTLRQIDRAPTPDELRALGPHVVPALRQLCTTPSNDNFTRGRACRALGQLDVGVETEKLLRRLAVDAKEDRLVRRGAVEGYMAGPAQVERQRAVTLLEELGRREDSAVVFEDGLRAAAHRRMDGLTTLKRKLPQKATQIDRVLAEPR
ncbi:MAG: hypothetical protein AB2A00_20440 [Myxococcota bacterium]